MKKPRPPTVDVSKLPFRSRDEWRWRWMQVSFSKETTLHRMFEVDRLFLAGGEILGVSACCMQGRFMEPGPISRGVLRGGARRCPRCCDAVGVAHGRGAPYNHGENEPGCQGPAKERKEI